MLRAKAAGEGGVRKESPVGCSDWQYPQWESSGWEALKDEYRKGLLGCTTETSGTLGGGFFSTSSMVQAIWLLTEHLCSVLCLISGGEIQAKKKKKSH